MEDIHFLDIEVTKANGNFKQLFNAVFQDFFNNYERFSKNFARECYSHYQLYKLFEDYKKKYGLYYIDGRINREYCSYTYNDILKAFNINKRTAERLIQCFNRYVEITDAGVVEIKDAFFPFSKSKLFELLPLTEELILKHLELGNLKYSMTKKEIREFVKELNGKTKVNKVIEDLEEYNEDECYSFDINKLDYEFSYFENQSKDALLNIVVQLYAYRQKHK